MSSVLLVDDDQVQQLVISKTLLLKGLNVIVANDGIEALETVNQLLLTINDNESCERYRNAISVSFGF